MSGLIDRHDKEFPNKKYKIIYADPPWSFDNWGYEDSPKGAEKHYSTMDIEDIKKLPVNSIADDNSVLFLWAVSPRLPDAFDVIKSWGFEYKTVAFTWVKRNQNKIGYAIGTGYYTRANSEYCLIAVKGKPLPRLDLGIPQICDSPRLEHSEKPDEIRKRILKLYGDLPRIELFARTKIHGWDVYGNDEKLNLEPLEAFSRG